MALLALVAPVALVALIAQVAHVALVGHITSMLISYYMVHHGTPSCDQNKISLFLPLLSEPGKPGVRSLGPDVRPSLSQRPCVDLIDVTLADEDTNLILTDNDNRAILGNVAMQLTQSGGQLWRQLITKF